MPDLRGLHRPASGSTGSDTGASPGSPTSGPARRWAAPSDGWKCTSSGSPGDLYGRYAESSSSSPACARNGASSRVDALRDRDCPRRPVRARVLRRPDAGVRRWSCGAGRRACTLAWLVRRRRGGGAVDRLTKEWALAALDGPMVAVLPFTESRPRAQSRARRSAFSRQAGGWQRWFFIVAGLRDRRLHRGLAVAGRARSGRRWLSARARPRARRGGREPLGSVRAWGGGRLHRPPLRSPTTGRLSTWARRRHHDRCGDSRSSGRCSTLRSVSATHAAPPDGAGPSRIDLPEGAPPASRRQDRILARPTRRRADSLPYNVARRAGVAQTAEQLIRNQ